MRYAIPIFFVMLSFACFAQDQASDTVRLLQTIKTHLDDTLGINALSELGVYYSKNNIQSSFRYFQEALLLSKRIHSIDKEIDILNELGSLHHKQGNYDSSLLSHRRALTKAIAARNSFQHADSRHLAALTFLRMAEYDSAREQLTHALAIALRENFYRLQSDVYVVWGNTFLEEGNDSEALKKFLLAAKLQDSLIHDPEGQSRALLNIANIQYKLGDFDKAIAYAREAQPLAKEGEFDHGVAYASQLLGRVYRKQKKYDEALTEYKKALAVYKRMADLRSMAETLQNIGNTLYDKGEISESGKTYYEALKISKQTANPTLLTYSFSGIAYFHYELKQYDRAFTYMDSSRMVAEKTGDFYSVLDAYELFASIKQGQRDYKTALDYFKKASVLKDSLTSEENKAGVAELEIQYKNDKQKKEIELLKKDQEVQKLELSRERANRIIIILVLIFVVIISFILVNRYRVLNRARRLVEMERMRNTIARDLHDDIGSTLSSINIISQMALKDANGSSLHFQRIAQHSSSMMESMSDIVWSINPNNDTLEQVISKMKEFASEILDPLNVEYSFSGEENLQSIKLDVSTRKNLFLIFKEAVNNAAKYSSASAIKIQFNRSNGNLELHILDNGKGFNIQTESSGNGLRNMKERANNMHGKLELKSSSEAGTEITLLLPIT